MKEEPKTRLDTLISIHNRMYDQAISLELDIHILDQDKKDLDITPDAVAYTDSLIKKKIESMERYKTYTRIALDLIREDMDKNVVSKNN